MRFLMAGVVSRIEDASGAAGSCFAPLRMCSVHQKAFFDTECPCRTGEACFLHRVPQKTPPVH